MDLNQLYSDHQFLLIRAERAPLYCAKQEHVIGASLVAGRIGCMQRALGETAAPVWEALAAIDGRSLAAPVCHNQGQAR